MEHENFPRISLLMFLFFSFGVVSGEATAPWSFLYGTLAFIIAIVILNSILGADDKANKKIRAMLKELRELKHVEEALRRKYELMLDKK